MNDPEGKRSNKFKLFERLKRRGEKEEEGNGKGKGKGKNENLIQVENLVLWLKWRLAKKRVEERVQPSELKKLEKSFWSDEENKRAEAMQKMKTLVAEAEVVKSIEDKSLGELVRVGGGSDAQANLAIGIERKVEELRAKVVGGKAGEKDFREVKRMLETLTKELVEEGGLPGKVKEALLKEQEEVMARVEAVERSALRLSIKEVGGVKDSQEGEGVVRQLRELPDFNDKSEKEVLKIRSGRNNSRKRRELEGKLEDWKRKVGEDLV